jgi:hypothetical protein
MRVLFYFSILTFAFYRCTLEKEEFLVGSTENGITLNLDYEIRGDKATNKNKYIIILLRDTADLYNQIPLSFYNTNTMSLPVDTVQKGFWILFKRWVNQDSVYESDPFFISPMVPENSKSITVKFNESVPVNRRKVFYDIKSIKINIDNHYNTVGYGSRNWDAGYLDDAVSGPLPDVYFKLDNLFKTGYTDFIDQPLGWFNYKFERQLIRMSQSTLTLKVFDYDFNTSPDDLILATTIYINDALYQQSVFLKGISKEISIDVLSRYSDSGILLVNKY